MKFTLTIEAENNEAVSSRQDVAYLLDGIARKLRSNTQVMSARVLDTGDNVVGEWTLIEPEDTPVWGTPVVPMSISASGPSHVLDPGEDEA